MSEPTRGPQSQQVRDAELTTGVMRGIDQIDSLNSGLESYTIDPIDSVPPEPYKKERLFSRKVLFGWAAATLIVWFVVRMIVPVVIETVGDEVRIKMKAPASNTATPVLAPLPPLPPVPVVAPAPAAPTVTTVTPDPAKK